MYPSCSSELRRTHCPTLKGRSSTHPPARRTSIAASLRTQLLSSVSFSDQLPTPRPGFLAPGSLNSTRGTSEAPAQHGNTGPGCHALSTASGRLRISHWPGRISTTHQRSPHLPFSVAGPLPNGSTTAHLKAVKSKQLKIQLRWWGRGEGA